MKKKKSESKITTLKGRQWRKKATKNNIKKKWSKSKRSIQRNLMMNRQRSKRSWKSL
jgi:hypothetical protein